MSDQANESSTSDNLVVASEVMSSTIRILSLLNLDDRQIAELFLAETTDDTPHDMDDDEDVTDVRPWRLGTLAEAESFSKAIDRAMEKVGHRRLLKH